MGHKWVYLPHEGNADMKDLLGGKGANLCEMWNMGLPVPPFFIVTTEGCIHYMKTGRMPSEIEDQVKDGIKFISDKLGRKFDDAADPLLLSVRSGAKFSMPGMMDTVLNIGMNKSILAGLIKKTKNERFARDCYRRLLQMFGDVVLGVDKNLFENALARKRKKYRVKSDSELPLSALKELADEYEQFIKQAGRKMPSRPFDQLMMGIETVYKSWNTERAIAYRNAHRIPHNLGTAVNVQAMVFGNIDDNSGSGVLFTRDPSTGEKSIFAELLFNSQGEEIVAGIRNPLQIDKLAERKPAMYAELKEYVEKLELRYKNMQDVEFTFEGDRLFILQCRNGKRTGPAAVRIASDMVDEGIITEEEAILQVDPELLVQNLLPRIAPGQKYDKNIIGKGLNASPGSAAGQIVFSSDRVLELIETAKKKGKEKPRLILVRAETNPDDFPGMLASEGILTSHGGMVSHAAVVARQMGKPCVAGCHEAKVDVAKGILKLAGKTFKEGHYITINGSEGTIIDADLKLVRSPEPGPYFERIMSWADKYRRLDVMANADKKEEAALARKLGAQGIGLCRTEHQFGGDRKMLVAELILILTASKPSVAQQKRRDVLLDKLLKEQRKDFLGVLEAMDGLPTTIRLIDPPLHEFLPTDEELATLRKQAKTKAKKAHLDEITRLRNDLREANPMLGLRGCRLGILFPIINKTQVRAIFEAACELKQNGKDPHPEIMVPLTMDIMELRFLERVIRDTADEVMKEYKTKIHYKLGTMIEIPRAALTASEIAEVAEFFSFGTNDLTQMAMGISRDDTAAMLKQYVDMGILPVDPFQVLDRRGVGRLMQICIEDARKTRPDILLGICGEHGGEADSVEFCHKIGLDYVSCSTYRVPGARLAAAQAVIKEKAEIK